MLYLVERYPLERPFPEQLAHRFLCLLLLGLVGPYAVVVATRQHQAVHQLLQDVGSPVGAHAERPSSPSYEHQPFGAEREKGEYLADGSLVEGEWLPVEAFGP